MDFSAEFHFFLSPAGQFLFNAPMQRFFDDFESINQFTLSLEFHRDKTECAHCAQNDQFISHGIIYKQRSMVVREPVGKRIFCSDRYGHSGCGHTFQLYVASEVSSLHYGAATLWAFITSLLLTLNVTEAYQHATGQAEPRQAWHWINRFMRRLTDYRRFLNAPPVSSTAQPPATTRRLHILLPTLKQLPALHPLCPCSSFQLRHQKAFI